MVFGRCIWEIAPHCKQLCDFIFVGTREINSYNEQWMTQILLRGTGERLLQKWPGTIPAEVRD